MEINNDVLSCAEEVFETFFRESGVQLPTAPDAWRSAANN
jgi:hypothetical protein